MYLADMLLKVLRETINRNKTNLQSLIRKIRLRMTLKREEIEHLKATFPCTKKWYGSTYGGFYINPDMLHKNSIVYSIGLGKDISFDRRVMKNHACQVYGFDPTPDAIQYIRKQAPNSLFHFYDYGIACESKIEKFYLPINKKGVSGSMVLNAHVNSIDFIEAKMKSLTDLTTMLGHKKIDVLKMDIEGSEYDVIANIMQSGIQIGQLLVEFHDRFFDGDIRSKKTVELLLQNGFEILGASLNYEEVSFINTRFKGQ